jgi:quercetin dioxygenase-like cupin family protein
MKRAVNQPETVSLTIYGGIYYRVWSVADAGTILPQHSHGYDHLTALLRGAVRVWCDSEAVGDFTAPDTIHIPAHHLHAFQTLVPDCMLACIHNADHADPDGEPAIAERHDLELED